MPEFINEFIAALSELPPTVSGMVMAMVIAIIRVFYDQQETKGARVFLEALLCGALSLAISNGILAMGLNTQWAVFAGGAVGYLGPTTVKSYAVRLLDRKTRG